MRSRRDPAVGVDDRPTPQALPPDSDRARIGEKVARGMPSLSSVRLAGRCDCSTNSMISAFSDAGYLMRPSSPSRLALFLAGGSPGSDRPRPPLMRWPLRRRSFTSPGVAARAVSPANRRLPASMELSLDQPKYIEALAMPSWRHSSEMFSSPRRPSSTMRIFSSADIVDASGAGCPSALVPRALCLVRDFLPFHLCFLAATMNQKSSLREVPQFVSRVLTANSPEAWLSKRPGPRIHTLQERDSLLGE